MQVAIVKPNQWSAEREGATHFEFVMHLDERVHAEAPRLRDHRSNVAVAEERQDQQDRIGTGNPRFGDLAQIDEEVLRENGSVELAACGGEIIDRTAEILAISQDAEGVGDTGVAARDRRRVGTGPDGSARGGSLLDFENEAGAWLSKRVSQAAPRRPGASTQSVQ